MKAEAIQALDCLNSNYSFARTNNDAQKIRALVPNSKIESYKQNEAKAKYVLQLGITPYFRKDMLQDFEN